MMLSVITPVYRSKNSLLPLYDKIKTIVHKLNDFTDYEIVMVEDCGDDGSWDIILQLATKDPHVKGITLSRNFGQHHAITAGMDLCQGDWIVVMDCDLQDDPMAIIRLWEKAKEGYDVVNVRRHQRKDSFIKKLRTRLFFVFFEWLSGISYDHQIANYRILSRKVVDTYKTMRESSRIFGLQICWLGYATANIDFPHAPRYDGKSSYNFRKLIALAFDVVISYSNKPLYISIVIGLFLSSASMVVVLWIFIRNLLCDIPVNNWTILIVSVWFLGGIIITNLGVLGIYISKIYNETKHRPLYAIANRVNC
ncbi:family 2 glycosyl transferase [Candidatus Magnetomorum sp. HK-1]|nr:family 2 glycosyl transferase [Candidatus Magnetomorum sp. HK-1]